MLARLVIQHRQDREGPCWIEDFIGDIVVRAFVNDRRDHGLMGIIPLGQLYPCAIAGCAAPAFGNDQQGCGELRAIGERHAHAAIAHLG